MERRRVPERMDEPGVPRDELDESLRFIRAINRRLGGVDALLKPLAAWAADAPEGHELRLIDIGTGSADIPVAAVRWACEHGVRLGVTAVDNHPTTLDLAREHIEAEFGSSDPRDTGITLVAADALALADRFGPRSHDIAHAGMFIHHLDELPALTALRVMDRLAARGVVWNDLIRSRVAQLGAWAMTRGANDIVRHDALASVRAGFTPGEALALAERAGWSAPRVRRSFVQQRFVVTAEKFGWRVLEEEEAGRGAAR